ncbi:hypothetical protein F2Q70_00031159 [Brassica cretica]|uniref:LisH domain-containing protein n=1 Tax=Brassica cretica TaxID=69181 RepID=A0A8S9FFI2_BRACR|nr:hypothetical protein F2Q70_00031159 [Brassica cretica]
MSSLTSVELNFLIFRYLQESGFTHAAFTLGYEAGINKCNIDGNMVPLGALVKFVQKGLQYMEMEANLSNGAADIDEDFSFFQPLDLISKDVNELQVMLRESKRKERDKEKDGERSKENEKEVEREHDGDRSRMKDKDRHEKQKEREREREKMERENEREREKIEREALEGERLNNAMHVDQIPPSNALLLKRRRLIPS